MTDNIAIVHEWFLDYMGSEKCVESFKKIYPTAKIYALLDFLNDEDRAKILNGERAETTVVQKLPKAKTSHRTYLPLYPYAIEQLDVSQHDVVLSSSHSVAKGVLTSAKQLHICYCHTPMRYAWDLYHQYIRESKLDSGLKAFIAKYFLHRIRTWDYLSAQRVDHFLANSKYIASRIKKNYRREADVIYPPVDVEKFPLEENKKDYYLIVARFVPYKKVDLVVQAFKEMKDKKLVVVGNGPDEKRLRSIATPNIKFLGFQSERELIQLMQSAKAFIYAAEEDFGITIVEAQACGTPIIAFGVGGATETVINNVTGILFMEQSVDSLVKAVKKFENSFNFDPLKISEHAQKFSRKRFGTEITNYIDKKYLEFRKKD